MIWVLIVVLALLCFTYLKLRGEDFSRYDSQLIPQPREPASDANAEVIRTVEQLLATSHGQRGRERLQTMRAAMDSMGEGHAFECRFESVDHDGVRGEWVVPPGVDHTRRLLYIHGGAWVAGSPLSHRVITNRLAITANAAVFSLDYRLLPEHKRQAGIDDCRRAWEWLQQHGPEGMEPATLMGVAGDSAGGNLTLSLVGWLKDSGGRQADFAIGLSPVTDLTFSAPSLAANCKSDVMLGPQFGILTRLPQPLVWWSVLLMHRMYPPNPVLSPLRGDLSGLPPILLQASECEMLLDDARRYVVRAQEAGSPVQLQTWPHMVHVWQIFDDKLPEAREAFDAIGEFIAGIESRRSAEHAA